MRTSALRSMPPLCDGIASDHVTRFPASDPTKLETFKAGHSGSGLAVDSLGNVLITHKLGSPNGAV